MQSNALSAKVNMGWKGNNTDASGLRWSWHDE